MDKLEQIFKLDKLLRKRRVPIPRDQLADELHISRATLTRLIKRCRDALHMPIQFDKDRDGYHYAEADKSAFQLPGFWFNESELLALMTSHRLLADVQPGILQPYLAPLQQRMEQLLAHKRLGGYEIFQRIRLIPIANREAQLEDFQQAASALIKRQRLRITHSKRSTGEVTERWVSPQRLVYYRDNWYLDTWCHLRSEIRTFSLDVLRVLESSGTALDIPSEQLDNAVKHSYGIFAGAATAKAVIRFSSEAAQWVADEQWHPQQQSNHLQDGKWELTIPYGNPTELIRDILKFGAHAEVISPPTLRKQVEEVLSKALRQYRKLK